MEQGVLRWRQGIVCCHAIDSILFECEACCSLLSMWLALCGLQNTQKESKFSQKRLGRWNERSPPSVHGVQDHGHCSMESSGPWRLVHGQPEAEHVGWSQFSSNQNGFGETWNSVGGYFLAATTEWCPTYQLCQAGHHIKRHQFSSPVAEQGATHEDRFCMHVPLGIRYPDWESVSAYQGSKWNGHQEVAEHSRIS